MPTQLPRHCQVIFSIDSIKVDFQRNKSDPDKDSVTLTAAGTNQIGDSATVGPISIGTPSSGAPIGPPLDPPIQTTKPFTLTDDDSVVLTCRINNSSHTDDLTNWVNALKIAGAISAVLGAGEQLAEKKHLLEGHSELELIMLEGLTVGAILGLAGEFIGDFGLQLGLSEPDCDGPVFDSLNVGLINLGGKALMDALDQGVATVNQPFQIAVMTDDKNQSQTHCGHNPSTTVKFMATITSMNAADPNFIGNIPGPATKFRPAVGLHSDAWLTTWGDTDTIEGSRILCTVSPPAFSVISGAPDGMGFGLLRNKLTALPQAADLIGSLPGESSPHLTTQVTPDGVASKAAPGQAPLTIPSGAAPSEAASALFAAQPLNFDIQEHMDSPSGEALTQQRADVINIPMLAAPFSANVFPIDMSTIDFIKSHPHTTTSAAPLSSSGQRERIVGLSDDILFSDSVILDSGVALQLYAAYDDADQFVGMRLRYRRMGGADFTDTDVMLQPAQHTVK